MSRGFSLIEALVALAVLSVGLLGAAAMLLGGLRTQRVALRHEAALGLVADTADRIRANPLAGAAYDTRAPVTGGACDASTACGPAALASHDITAFQSAANRLLPAQQPQTAILFEPAIGTTTPDRYVISLRWQDPRDPQTSDEVTLTVLAQPVAGTA